MKVLYAKQIRELEKKAVKEGISYIEMMEHAGTAAAQLFLQKNRKSKKSKGQEILIFAGKGNNGGDGFVAARILSAADFSVSVILVEGNPKTEIAKHMFHEIQKKEISILNWSQDKRKIKRKLKTAGTIIDAIYGIGFHGTIPFQLNELFQQINNSPAEIFAFDIPSALICDTGLSEGLCIQADYTISFSTLKPAHIISHGKQYCGDVIVASVGIPEGIIQDEVSYCEITEEWQLKSLFLPREQDTNKGNYGTLLSLCGSEGMAGAAILSTQGALRTGVGSVTIALPPSIYSLVSPQVPEAVCILLEKGKQKAFDFALNKASACLVGCGLGKSPEAKSYLLQVLANQEKSFILDADALNILADEKKLNLLKNKKDQAIIITPHPGEMARLTGLSIAEIQVNRMSIAKDFADQYNLIVVLKGSKTVIACPHHGTPFESSFLFINPTGNPGMAKAGSGDVLAGIIASLVAQGVEPYQAAVLAVYVHGLAGDKGAKRLSQRALLPTDIVEELSTVFLEIENKFYLYKENYKIITKRF